MSLRLGSAAAFVGAASVLFAAVAREITEPSGIAITAAVFATIVAYGLVPLMLTAAMRQGALSSWWAVAAAFLAAALWSAAGLLFAAPALLPLAPAMVNALVTAAPSASALWILAASVEVVRAGRHRWSLVFIAAFVAVLMIGSAFIELSGFDIRRVLVPLGWAAWMVDAARAIRARSSPATERPTAATADAPCANCGAPRRTDGLAFCSRCGLPYGARRA